MSSVAYLLAAYPGPRLNGDSPEYARDYSLYLRYHLERLDNLKHDCDLVLCINEPNSYSTEVQQLLSELNYTNVLFRPNIGASYAAWNNAFHIFPDYDYYILMEDDYVPMQDHFDERLVEIIQQEQAAYVCTMLGWGHGGGDLPHAGISNGIVDGNVVRKVLATYGDFPHSRTIQDYDHYAASFGQVKFSQKFLAFGSLVDFQNYYKAPYWRVNNLNEYYEHNQETLIAPYQLASTQ